MKNSVLKRRFYAIPNRLCLAIALSTASPAMVMAQGLGGGLVLEEIVVTATKKDEMVQDVPSTVNVLTADRMKELNVFNFKDVETLTPGLSLTNVDARNSTIAMRGISYNPDSLAAAAVVTYFNGIPIRPDVAFQQMYDLGRIEVLRGPQGTLQGETSPAGSIQFYNNKANLDAVEGEVIQTFSDNGGMNTQVAASVPVIEGKLAVRVAGLYDEAETGIEQHTTVGGGTATRDTRSGRLGVNWMPIDSLSVDSMYQYLENSNDGYPVVEGSPNPANGAANQNAPALHHSDRKTLAEGPYGISNRFELFSLEVNYEFADHLLTSVTGYQETLNESDRDQDTGNAVIGAQTRTFLESTFQRKTQEVRITNTNADYWEYTAGLFYQNTDSYTYNLAANTPGGFPTPLVAPILTEQYGAFLDNKWYISDDTAVGFGARWQKVRSNTKTTLFPSTLDREIIPEDEQIQKGIAWTGGLKLTHDLNEEVMVYSSYDHSYRPAGYTVTPSALNPALAPALGFDEETSNSLEIGFKSSLENGRYQLNGALFYQAFKDYISRANNVAFDSTGDGFTNSVIRGGLTYNGDAVIQGAELEFTGVLTENWTAFLGASYTDGKFEDAERPLGDIAVATNNGLLLTSATNGRIGPEPNWSVSASSEYSVSFGELNGFVRGLYKFNGNRADDGTGSHVGGYGLFDIFIGVRSDVSGWEVTAWSKNLFDKDARSAFGEIQTLGGAATGYQEVSVVPERTFGVTGKYQFGIF